MRLTWVEVDASRLAQSGAVLMSETQRQREGVPPSKYFEADAGDYFLIAILSDDPVGPNGSLETHLSMSKSSQQIPFHRPFGRPSNAEWKSACAQIAVGKRLYKFASNDRRIVHGYSDASR